MGNDWYCDEVLNGRRLISVVYEDDTVLAFHHTRPSYADAHIVVIPKRHVPSLLSREAFDELPGLLRVIRAVAADVLEAHGACRVVTNLGRYQDSQHLHWHVIAGDLIAQPVELAPGPDWITLRASPPGTRG